MLHQIWGFDWTKISFISITISVLIGLRSYLRSVKINKMDFYFRIKDDFDSDESKNFIGSIIDKTIFLKDEVQGPVLKYIDNEVVHELGTKLLDSIEDLCIFYKDGFISLKYIVHGFGDVIEKTEKSQIVVDYITQLRKRNHDQQLYTGLFDLQKAIKKYPKWHHKLFNYLREKYYTSFFLQ